MKLYRRCKICQKVKLLAHFKLHKNASPLHTCRHCYNEERRRLREANKETINAATRERREGKRAEQNEKRRARARKNHDQVLKKQREYYSEHKNEINKTRRAKYAANPEARKPESKKYYENHSDQIKARAKRWRRTFPERMLLQSRRASSKRRLLVEPFEPIDFTFIPVLYKRQKARCIACRMKLGRSYHIDHIIPISKGGTNKNENLQLLCRRCNLSKGQKDAIIFMQAQGWLL